MAFQPFAPSRQLIVDSPRDRLLLTASSPVLTEPIRPADEPGEVATPDVAAWYADHHRRVFGVCLRLLGNAEEAEDATQDVFVDAWRGWATFRGDSAMGTWLHGIAVHVALRRLRDARRRPHAPGDDSDVDELRARPAMHDQRMDLETAVQRLPERARVALVLHEIQGYRVAEVAELMGTSVGTVKSQLHRARQLLMEVLR